VKHKLARQVPPIRRLLDQRDALGARVRELERELEDEARVAARAPQLFPAGHYYSPIAPLDEVRSRAEKIFGVPRTLPEIDLQEEAQLELLRAIAPFARDVELSETATTGQRYYLVNDFFGHGDAVVLQALLRWLQPKRLVEVGSGFSSALILDTNERYLDRQLECTFIEPYPDRLMALLNDEDRRRSEIIVSPLQDVDLGILDELGPRDVLFIDSSHVSKVGSDVNLLMFEVLPRLQPGVFVHFHDIFYPFEYLRAWVDEGRNWNEAYILRAYLEANHGYRIRLWNSYLAALHHAEAAECLPLWSRNTGGSLWLERLEPQE
jgi:hypothetical protein